MDTEKTIPSAKKEADKPLLVLSAEWDPTRLWDETEADAVRKRKKGMKEKGITVTSVMPYYRQIPYEIRRKTEFLCHFDVPVGWRQAWCGIRRYEADGMTVYFTENEQYFDRDRITGCYDDAERFSFFCHAVTMMPEAVGIRPDLLVTNDWQTALCGILIRRSTAAKSGWEQVKWVHELPGLAYPGRYARALMGDVFGLSDQEGEVLLCDGALDLTAGAARCCDVLTVPGRGYAEHLAAGGIGGSAAGTAAVIASCGVRISGIPDVPARPDRPYSAKEKAAARALWRERLGLAPSDGPFVSFAAPLTADTGAALLLGAADELLRADLQLIVMGRGDGVLEEGFRALEERHPDRFRLLLRHSPSLTDGILSASDLFLYPALTAPSAHTVWLARHFGTVPLVRGIDACRDAVAPVSDDLSEGNGFLFDAPERGAFLDAFWRAFGHFIYERLPWQALAARTARLGFGEEDDPALTERAALWRQPVKKKADRAEIADDHG